MCLFGASARAQGNYRSAALGGRSALMGDTGVALGTDGAAPFLNPATVVRVESTLALSVTFVSLDVLHGASWYTPGPVDPAFGSVPTTGADIFRVSGNAIPSTLCLFTDLPKLSTVTARRSGTEKIATCLGTTEIQQFDWTGQGYQPPGASTIQSSSVRSSWQRFVVAPTYAVTSPTSSRLASRSRASSRTSGPRRAWAPSRAARCPSRRARISSARAGDFDLGAVLGATLTLDRLSIGASIQSPDVSIPTATAT